MGKLEEIAELLKKRIDGGVYPPNLRLPSEYELADELGVNRITLNKAVNRLIADGYLRRGSSSRDGTYVRDRSELVKGTLGLLIRCGNLYADQLMHGVIDGALRNNYLLSVMAPELEEVRIAERKMLANGIEGVFLASYANFRWRKLCSKRDTGKLLSSCTPLFRLRGTRAAPHSLRLSAARRFRIWRNVFSTATTVPANSFSK